MDLLSLDPSQFITLTPVSIAFLLAVGFVGGLVSGFIGSGGAFILTPGMMGLGVPGAVAVASNMCHKFPKAMVGAIKRYRFGQVDIKLVWLLLPRPVLACRLAYAYSGIFLQTGDRPVPTFM